MKSLLPLLVPAPLSLFALCDPAGAARSAQETTGEPRSLLTAVPADAVAFALASDLAGLRADAEKNAWGRLLGDAQFAPIWDKLRAEALSELGEGEADSAELCELFLDSLQGSMVLFAAGADLDRPSFGFLIDPGEGRASFEEFLAKVDQDGDSDTSYEEYGGVSLAITDEGDGPNVEFEVDGVWGVAQAPAREEALELAHGIIDRLRGSSEASLATSPLLGAARSGSFPGRIELFADAQRLMAAVEAGEEDEEAQRALELIGLGQLSWMHGTMDLGEGEALDLHLRMALPGEGYLADWLAALGPLPRRLAVLGPASAVGASLYNVDLFAIYESAWDLFADIDPEAYEQARTGFENGLQSMGGLDLEGDFLAQLTGEFANFSVPVPEEEFAANSQLMGQAGMESIPDDLRVGPVYVVGLEDASAVELFLEQALDTVGAFVGVTAASIESEDFQGFQVQSLALPMGLSLNWCFTDDFVAGSMFPSALRSTLALHGKEDAPTMLTNKHFGPHVEQHARASVLSLAPSASSVRLMLGMLGMVSEMQASATWDNSESGESTDWPFAGIELPDPSLADRYLQGTLIFKLERGPAEISMGFMAR